MSTISIEESKSSQLAKTNSDQVREHLEENLLELDNEEIE